MKKCFLFMSLVFFINCDNKKVEKSKYPRHIGDSSFNFNTDDTGFVPCNGDNKIVQYFNYGEGLEYVGEKKALIDIFRDKYTTIDSKESGLIRIRFIVNCKGDTGRFRITQMNNEYQEIYFNNKIVSQLLKITKELKSWKIKNKEGWNIDYYQYLIFRIKEGKLIEILP